MKSNTFKLSREMKLALTGAALVGAVGGWYTWNSTRAPDALPITSPATSAAAPTETAPANGASNTAPSGVTVTRPKNPVDVQQIPFLTTTPPAEQAPAAKPGANASAAPSDALVNPFRPFSVTADASNPSNPAPAGGALPAPSVPNVPTRPPVVASAPPVPMAPPLGAPIPLPSANVAGAAPFPGGLSVTPTPPRQKPPVPTVRPPATATLTTPATLPTPGTTATASTTTVVPPVLSSVREFAASAPLNPLDAYVSDQNLSYNAVVLGPVNTGIFQTKSGYVVVSIGQKLPQSDIVVKDISASAVTLALGDSQKTLELDKR